MFSKLFASVSSLVLAVVSPAAAAAAVPVALDDAEAAPTDAVLAAAPDVTDLLEPVSSGQPVVRELELPMPRWTYELDDEDTMLDMQAVTAAPRTRNLAA
jgi:hypothetical protein